MILDAFWLFTGGTQSPGNSDGKTDSPTTGTQQSSNVIDIGVGSSTNPALPPGSAGGGGRDLGIGDDPALKILVQVTTAFGNGTSIAVALQGAPDNGSGAAGSFTTYISGPTVNEAQLVVGVRLLEIDMPRLTVPSATASVVAPPRFLQLQYTNSGTHNAGKIEALAVLDRHDQIMQSNATLGGYPAGITVAN